MSEHDPNKSPAEIANEIAEDNTIDDGAAVRKLLALMISVQEDAVVALWDIHEAFGMNQKT